MAKMEHRERVLAAVERQKPDRIPIDFGGTTATTITLPAYERLKGYLRVATETVIFDVRSQLARPDEKILEAFNVDTRPLLLRKPEELELRIEPDGSFLDDWGVRWKREPGSHYYVGFSPLAGDISIADLEKYPWPDPADPRRYEGLGKEAKALHRNTDYAVVLNLPSPFVHSCQFLRGFENWLVDLIVNPSLAEALMEQ